MDIKDHNMIFETAAPAQRRPDRSPAKTDHEEAGNFSSLLVEKQERPEKHAAITLDKANQKLDSVKTEQTGEPVAADNAADGKSAASLDKAAAMTGTSPANVVEGTTVAGAPAATQSEMPTVLAQGIAVQSQSAATDAVVATPGQATPGQAQSGQALSGQALPSPSTGLVNTETEASLPKTAPLPAADKAVMAEVSTPTASELESAAKGKASYTQAPVVSESQIVADSLKSEARNQSLSNTADVEEDGAVETKPIITVDVALGDESQSGATAQEQTSQGQASQGPTSADQPSDIAPATSDTAVEIDAVETAPKMAAVDAAAAAVSAADLQTVSDLAEIVVEHSVTETNETATDDMAAVAGETITVTRSGESQFQTSATQPATNPLLTRNIRHQVMRQFSSQLADITGQEKISIKLNPESLGQIELNFEAQDDRLNVVISASTREAEGAMRENLKELTDSIVERSSRFSHVDVRVEIREASDTRQESKQDQKQDDRQDQRKEQERQGNNQGRQGQQAQKAWESAMSWELAEQAANEEG